MPNALAQRYAHALADAVLDPKSSVPAPQAAADLRTFESMVQGSPEFRHVLLSPAIPAAKKRAAIGRFADALPLSRLVRNFLYILVDRRRTEILGEIAEAFDTVLDERLGFVRANVTSAAPLNETQQRDIEQTLSRVTGKKVRCAFSVDPELIGGVVARIGSTIYDGSVRTQLQTLSERLAS